MNNKEYCMFTDFIRNECGMHFNEKKRLRFENRIAKRMMKHNIKEYSEYFQLLCKKDLNELNFLYNILTVNETYFYRNEPHFKILTDKVLPELIKKKQRVINIWSAACSTGDEAYTIALTVKEFFKKNNIQCTFNFTDIYDKNTKQFNPDIFYIKIIGSDISKVALNIAKSGQYSKKHVQKIPINILIKNFTYNNKSYIINQDIKECVEFRYLNLMQDKYPFNIDVVFLRNVLMYFNDECKLKIIAKIEKNMKENGYLFIGDAETLSIYTDIFVTERIYNSNVYRKNSKLKKNSTVKSMVELVAGM